MKTTVFAVLTSFLLFFTVNAFSQTASIYFAGKIDTSLINRLDSSWLQIKINETCNLNNQAEIIQTPIEKDGSFEVTLESKRSFTYLSFWILNNQDINSLHPTYQNLDEVYLFKQGDSVNCLISKNRNLKFTGKGSEKLNCQYQLYSFKQQNNIQSRISTLARSHEYNQMYSLMNDFMEASIQMKLSLLKSYKIAIEKEVYHRLYLDVIGSAGYDIQRDLYRYIFGTDSFITQRRKATQKYFQTTLEHNILSIDSSYMAESAYYPEMIFLKEFNAVRLFSKNGGVGQRGSFKSVYEGLKNKYTGKLLDKLIIICYQQLVRYYSEESKLFVDDALNTIQDKQYRHLLSKWRDKQNIAYPFDLSDTNGKIHQLADYLGKLVVIDFWFTGCYYCTQLNQAMHPIIEQFRKRDDIVFLTVSTDKSRQQWIKSLESGKYTSPSTINLYTNGLGEQYPMIKFYNFVGAPQQLIISKKGTLITSYPPRPDASIENAKAFRKIIDDNLNIPSPATTGIE